MAFIDGKPVDLHRLEKDEFVLADQTRINPARIKLDKSEMDAMLASRQAGFLVEKYEPIEAKDGSVTFKLRSNHSRSVFRRERREAAKKHGVK